MRLLDWARNMQFVCPIVTVGPRKPVKRPFERMGVLTDAIYKGGCVNGHGLHGLCMVFAFRSLIEARKMMKLRMES